MSGAPLISIVTATRNRLDLVGEAMRSIAAQDFTDYEAIVVDDGSSADVQQGYDRVLAELPARFRVVLATPAGSLGRGSAAARNIGVREARGEYVAFLDDDDRWIREDHLSVAAATLRESGADLYFSNLMAVRDGEIVSRDWFPQVTELVDAPVVHEGGRVHRLPERTVHMLAGRQGAHPDGWVVRRSVVVAAGGFWDQGAPAEDYQLFTRLLDAARGVLYRSVPTVAYRLPAPDSVSARFTRLEEDLHVVMNALHLQAHCANEWAQRAARAQQAWHLRRLSSAMLRQRRMAPARAFAFQAVCAHPTPGALWHLARTLAGSVGVGLPVPDGTEPDRR